MVRNLVLVVRGVAALAVLGLLAAACGSTVNQASRTSGGGDVVAFGDSEPDEFELPDFSTDDPDGFTDFPDDADDGTGVSAGAPGTPGRSPTAGRPPAAGGSPPSAGTAVAGRNSGRGFTETQVKVGFVTISQEGTGSTGDIFGVEIDDGGDGRRQVEAIVKYVNERGGVAGREVVPVIAERSTSSSDPNQLESICTRLTQDEQVFAVVTNFARDSERCYAQHQTLLLNDGVQSEFGILRPLNPYIWVPGLPTQEAGYVALLDGLAGQDYFSGDVKLGIVGYEDARTQETYERVVLPRLKALGHEPTRAAWVMVPESDADNAQWAQQIQSAQLRFAADGITHVFFMAPGAGVPLIFMTQAEAQLYRPRYGLSSYDSPGFLLQPAVPPTQLRGSLGGGFNLIVDVDGQRGDPYPSEPAETECYEALQANGDSPPPARATFFQGAYLCDGIFMLQKAAEGLTNLSVAAWAANAERLDGRFQASYSLPGGTRFAPGIRAGGQSYRFLRYSDGCRCFEYASDNRPIPPLR